MTTPIRGMSPIPGPRGMFDSTYEDVNDLAPDFIDPDATLLDAADICQTKATAEDGRLAETRALLDAKGVELTAGGGATLADQLRAKEVELAGMHGEIDCLKRELSEARAAIASAQSTDASTRAEVDALKERLAQVERRYQEAEKENTLLRAQMQADADYVCFPLITAHHGAADSKDGVSVAGAATGAVYVRGSLSLISPILF